MHILRLGDWLRNDQLGLDSLCVSLQRWMQFWGLGSKLEENEMSAMLQDVPEVGAAYEEFKRFTADPVMRKKAIARQRYLIEQSIIMNDVLEEGRAKEKIATVQKMKTKGYPATEIAEITGLSLSEIEQLN
jgi:predicted transposase/invertase (TIGR01784 family)